VFLRSLLSIGIAMTVIIVMILPKLRRVWSGEKVVLTTVLDARYKPGSTPSAGGTRCTHEDKASVVTAAEERIRLKEGDPLPYPVEQQVLRLYDVLRTVEDRWYVSMFASRSQCASSFQQYCVSPTSILGLVQLRGSSPLTGRMEPAKGAHART
jgi:hypothetical protein